MDAPEAKAVKDFVDARIQKAQQEFYAELLHKIETIKLTTPAILIPPNPPFPDFPDIPEPKEPKVTVQPNDLQPIAYALEQVGQRFKETEELAHTNLDLLMGALGTLTEAINLQTQQIMSEGREQREQFAQLIGRIIDRSVTVTMPDKKFKRTARKNDDGTFSITED